MGAAHAKSQKYLKGCVLNFDCTSSIVRKLDMGQPSCPVQSAVAEETAHKLLKNIVDALP
jgi:hypothetical protein